MLGFYVSQRYLSLFGSGAYVYYGSESVTMSDIALWQTEDKRDESSFGNNHCLKNKQGNKQANKQTNKTKEL